MTPDEKENEKGKGKAYRLLAVAFVLGMGVAFLAAWLLFAPGESGSSPSSRTEGDIEAEALAPFLAAVEAKDYAGMRDAGTELFREGARLPDAERVLAEYLTNSFPPYMVYAFYSAIGADSTRRVLLTLDEGGKVVSFLAEEMEIAK